MIIGAFSTNVSKHNVDVPLVKVRFRIDGQLRLFLKPAQRVEEFAQAVGETDTVKHAVESIGVPHPEVGTYRINGVVVDESAQMSAGDFVEVLAPAEPIVLADARFVIDGHLGRLAAYLRMLGFDCWYERDADDLVLASVAGREHRLLLTRDVGLLKRKEVERGYCVRSHKPHEQLREVTRRYALMPHFAPFQRCMECNGPLHGVEKDEVMDQLPPHTKLTKDIFSRCERCGKVYWRGSHYERMLGWIEALEVRE